MAKFRKKPVVIEAVQLTNESVMAVSYTEKQLPKWITDNPAVTVYVTGGIENSQYAEIKTLEGTMRADANDWIIMGVKGEFYPCKPDIFEATYERVEE